MKRKNKLFLFCVGVLTAVSCFSLLLAGCGKEEDSKGKDSSSSSESLHQLSAPTNFTFNTETGDFSFTATDKNAGYYFVRCFAVTNGTEANTYTVSSSRIAGGSTGEKTGNVDVSGFGWGDYNIKLVTFAAAGSGYGAPETQVLKAQYGVGGVLEKPEMLAMTEGNQVELVIDWYTINDYYMYQFLPTVTFNFYSDEALTTVVKTDTVDLHDLLATIDVHPAGGYIWGYSNDSLHKPLGDKGYLNDIYTYTLDAGTYWVTATANTTSSAFSASKPSDAVKITLTGDAATGAAYESVTTALWKAPSTMGVPVAMKNDEHSDRVDYAGSQTTSSKIVS